MMRTRRIAALLCTAALLATAACSTDKVKSAAGCAKATAEVTAAVRSLLESAANDPGAAASSGREQVDKLVGACGDSSGTALSTVIVLVAKEASGRTGDSQTATKALLTALCQAASQVELSNEAETACAGS